MTSDDESDSGNDIEISVNMFTTLAYIYFFLFNNNNFVNKINLINYELIIDFSFHLQTAETVESIVCQLMEKQRLSRQAALVKQLDCGCGDASCADGKTCTHPVMRRPSLIKSSTEKRLPASNAADSFAHGGNNGGTPNVVVGPKVRETLEIG